ncbi:MAG: GIY-YIG nuclease family protein [Alphaproteobacteria bacterium]|nr:GIY-YIG nuclease family protein [Alphaproteobacteria bacterium]
MGTIYMIRNIKNDKRYVGQSVQPVEKRFRQHIEAAYLEGRRAYNTCLSRAIRKHGSDFFEVGVLAEDVPDDDLDIVEAHYIDMYNTLAPNGYNKSVGFNDNSLAEELDDLTDDNDYSDNAKVMIDDVSDDDVDRFLREL